MSFYNPPPPSYGSTLKLSLLCLDGGGTRTLVQLQILCELMHRLAWDMGFISSRPSIPQKYHVYPADCFDYIGAGGCGAIIAYLLAAGHTAEAALTQFLTLTPILASTRLHAHPAYPGESLTELEIALDACLPRHELMPYQDDWIVDIPARTNVWIATPSSDASNLDDKSQKSTLNGPGVLIPKGAPLRLSLLPLVLAEVEREMRGRENALEHTLEFLQAVCPVFEDCDLLLALGSGEVPVQYNGQAGRQTRKRKRVDSSCSGCENEMIMESVNSTSPSSKKLDSSSSPSPSSSYWLATTLFTWLCYTTSTSTSASSSSCNLSSSTCRPPQLPAPLPPCTPSRDQSRALYDYIPTRAYGRSYIRLSPDLTTRASGTLRAGLTTFSTPPSSPFPSSRSSSGSSLSGQPQLAWPADWEPEHFSEQRMLTASYCGKAEVGISMDRVVHVLGRRELPGVMRRAPNSSPSASTSATPHSHSPPSTSYSPPSTSWGSAPQYCLAAGKAKGQDRVSMGALEDKRRLDEMVFEMAGYVF